MRGLWAFFGFVIMILFWIGVDKVFADTNLYFDPVGKMVNDECCMDYYKIHNDAYNVAYAGTLICADIVTTGTYPLAKANVRSERGWDPPHNNGFTATYAAITHYCWSGSAWVDKGNEALYFAQDEAEVTNASLTQYGYPTDMSLGEVWNPTVNYPTGPPESCGMPPDCNELTGEIANWVEIPGAGAAPNDICIDDCEVERTALSVTLRKTDCDGDGTADDPCSKIVQVEYTGQACPAGGEGEPDDRDCTEKQAECEAICAGGDWNECTDPDTYVCDCELPEYPLVQTGPSTFKPDQDGDGLPTGDPSETDADGDTTPDNADPDPDGDDIIRGDADPDGDGIDNRGKPTFQNSSKFSWTTNHNGMGTDPDLNGDGTPNGDQTGDSDDPDGDGIPNNQDSDKDGDDVNNDDDVDADGNGIVDSPDDDPQGDATGEADTNQDGEVTEEDDPPGEAPEDMGSGGVCPDGEICIGDGVCQSGEDDTSADCVGADYLKTRWQTLQNNIMGTGIGSLVSLGELPSSSDYLVEVDLGTWGGSQSFDLRDLNFAWALLNGLFTIMFCWLGIKIIILKHG